MRSFYHAVTSQYKRRASLVMVFAAIISCETAMIAFFVLFFNFFSSPSENLIYEMLTAASVSIAAGLIICLVSALAAKRKTERHSRYTYIDVQLKAVVYSRYCEEYSVMKRKVIFRELFYIPLSGFVSAEPSRNGNKIIINAKMRRYFMDSDDLGYHIKNGDFEFDQWWLNSGGYEEVLELIMPADFGKAERICKAFYDAKKRFSEIPQPKKYVFKEADFIRRRPKPRLLPDNPDFSRRWK